MGFLEKVRLKYIVGTGKKPYPATRLFPFSGQGQRPAFNLDRESGETLDDETEVPKGDLENEYNPDLLDAYDLRLQD